MFHHHKQELHLPELLFVVSHSVRLLSSFDDCSTEDRIVGPYLIVLQLGLHLKK
jgi:hypothetical protein